MYTLLLLYHLFIYMYICTCAIIYPTAVSLAIG